MEIILDYLMKGSLTIIGIIVGYFIANNKYVFQKTYDQKLAWLVDLYGQIVNLEFMIKEYAHFKGADMQKDSIGERMQSLNKIKEEFQKFQHKFWEVEIILDDNSVKEIEKFLKKYIEIISKLTVSNINLQLGDFKSSFNDWDHGFKLISSDLAGVKNELKKDFKKTLTHEV